MCKPKFPTFLTQNTGFCVGPSFDAGSIVSDICKQQAEEQANYSLQASLEALKCPTGPSDSKEGKDTPITLETIAEGMERYTEAFVAEVRAKHGDEIADQLLARHKERMQEWKAKWEK